MILTDATDAAAVYLDDLVANPDNPRQSIGDVTELAESIREQGLLTPLLVVRVMGALERYMVVDGHRRLAALRSIDFDDTIPVRVVDLDLTGRILAALATQGKPLDPIDEARAYQALIDLDLTQRQIADKVGCNQSHVSRRLALLDLDVDTAKSVQAGTTKLRDAEAKARGKEPVKPKPATVGVDYAQATGWRDEAAALKAENAALREIAAKAREAVVEVKAQIDNDYTEATDCPICAQAATDRDDALREVEELRLEVAELRAALAELEADDDALFPQPSPVLGDAAYDMARTEALAIAGYDAEPENPDWLTKQPWGTYTMSSDTRVLALVAKLTKVDSVRHVIAFETAHDARVDVLEAARARLVELGSNAAA